MKISHHKTSRTITAAEVKGWFGESPMARLREVQYREIADRLTKFRWPSDPPAPSNSPWLPKETIEADPNRWWDFKAAYDAAKMLLKSVPAMVSHWDGLRWAPETSGGYEAVKSLGDALAIALPYIEWPVGQYERRTHRKMPKAWHLPAILIALVVIKAMIEAGHNKPGITRNSVVVRVVHQALIRMKYPDSRMITATAIAAYLTRRDKKYGLTPKGITALTTK